MTNVGKWTAWYHGLEAVALRRNDQLRNRRCLARRLRTHRGLGLRGGLAEHVAPARPIPGQ